MSTIKQLITLMETQNGRDKMLRLVVYSSRIAQWVAAKNNVPVPKLEIIDQQLTDGRKLFRMFKYIKFIRDLISLQGKPFTVTRFIAQFRLFCLTLLHIHQQFMWLAKYKLVTVEDRPALARRAGFWWLLSLICSHIQNYNEFMNLKRETKKLASMDDDPSLGEQKMKLIKRRETLYTKIIQDSFNTPLSYINSRGLKKDVGLGFIGLCGTVSSCCSLKLIWPKS
uniref:Uncharacterized protein n=1 Tax=Paramoeba aestuarina TaxID=180227 RepID=A0A7S4JHX5_9EUKA|mmetsp:Transcript_10617/g.15980  ORF Transcript_10617/g.15980 Transcript_10617/m.15980 type:complete len:225 (+) Transcript_10617:85-759(+)